MSQHDLLIRFWGVRGSYPVPGPGTAGYGGNTSCIEVRNDKHLVILDAGTGIIPLGEKLIEEYHQRAGDDQKLYITVLLTHTHHDHIQGLPFFKPAYLSSCLLYVYGPRLLGEDLQDSISQLMQPKYCPVRLEELNSEKVIVNMADTDTLLFQNSGKAPVLQNGQRNTRSRSRDDLLVSAHRSYAHPKDGVFVYKVSMNGKSIVYATDVEGYAGGDSRLINFARNADVLIHDSQYKTSEYTDPDMPKQGFGHSTIEMACEVAEKAGVGKLVLFHHDPAHRDEEMDEIEKFAQSRFRNTIASREGLEIHV